MWQVGVVVGLACCGGACVQWVSAMVGLVCCIGVACGEVSKGRVGVKVRLACHVGMALRQCRGKSCAP